MVQHRLDVLTRRARRVEALRRALYGPDAAARAAALTALSRSRARRRAILVTVSAPTVVALFAVTVGTVFGTKQAVAPRIGAKAVSSECAPLPAGWRCTLRDDGTILVAHPTAAWDRDATRLPEDLTYEISPGSNTIVAAYSGRP